MKKIALVQVFIFSVVLNAICQNTVMLPVYSIPGQNGLGGDPDYIKGLLGDNHVEMISVSTPKSYPDLGQRKCINLLRETCLINKDKKFIIHATSQGTATALNYLVEDQGRQIQALILESALVSGNSAIYHTVSGPLMDLKKVTKLPFAYYWLPYCAKVFFPWYSPGGIQPIFSIDSIPTTIPIIIIHSQQDYQLSYNDACALYYRLRACGNDNVYLISKDGSIHINTMKSLEEKSVIQAIFKRYNLIDGITPSIDLNVYQPDHEQFKRLYEDLIQKEKKHKYLKYGIYCGLAATLLGITLKYKNSLYDLIRSLWGR